MKINHLSLTFVFVLLTLLTSCKDDDEPQISTTLVNSQTHHIKVVETNDNLELTIEILSDTTNNLIGNFPDIDLITIAIDKNANGIIDEDFDWGIGILDFNEICTYYLIDSMTISGCGILESEASLNSNFISSSLSPDNHIVWNISIPKEELDDSKPLNMVIKTLAAGEGYTTFPEDNIYNNSATISFSAVLSLDW